MFHILCMPFLASNLDSIPIDLSRICRCLRMSRLVFFCKQSTYNRCSWKSSLLALSRFVVGFRSHSGIDVSCFFIVFSAYLFTSFLTSSCHGKWLHAGHLLAPSVPFRFHFGSLSAPFLYPFRLSTPLGSPRLPFGSILACFGSHVAPF